MRTATSFPLPMLRMPGGSSPSTRSAAAPWTPKEARAWAAAAQLTRRFLAFISDVR